MSVRGFSMSRDTLMSSSIELSNRTPRQSMKVSGGPDVGFVDPPKHYTAIEQRRKQRVIVGHIDCTPDDLIDPEFPLIDNLPLGGYRGNRPRKSEISNLMSTTNACDAGLKVYTTIINLDDIHIDHTINTEEYYPPSENDNDRAPSAFHLPKMLPVTKYPKEANITLKETETMILLELPSVTAEKGTEEATLIEQENELYAYLTVGKGRNRKTVSKETQTELMVTQTRHTTAGRPEKRNAASFASAWDMHDTYTKISHDKRAAEPDEMVMFQRADERYLRKPKTTDATGKSMKLREILTSSEFRDAVLLVDRVIAANVFATEQKLFRGLVKVDPLSLDLVYTYTLKSLWVFKPVVESPIAHVACNLKNENIIAVAHGRYTYSEQHPGHVVIWCTKNPLRPERVYKFEAPTTAVAFSNLNPNKLAVGFGNGEVMILDIRFHNRHIISRSSRTTNPCYLPIWVVKFQILQGVESVVSVCEDGRINRFQTTKTNEFMCSQLMRAIAIESKIKLSGLAADQYISPCAKHDVELTRYPAVHSYLPHPKIDHLYYIGTEEGCIHKCSYQYLNQHVELWRTHSGPVYKIVVSPFMPELIATCGADGTVRLWIENIQEVILTLHCTTPVHDMAFSPKNSTLLLTVSSDVLGVWDLRRKTHEMCAKYFLAPDATLIYIKFVNKENNIVIADTKGSLYTYHLEDTPLPPYYQLKLLEDCIYNVASTRPQLMRQLKKIWHAKK